MRRPTLVDGEAATAVGLALCERHGVGDQAGVERTNGDPAAADLLQLPPAVSISKPLCRITYITPCAVCSMARANSRERQASESECSRLERYGCNVFVFILELALWVRNVRSLRDARSRLARQMGGGHHIAVGPSGALPQAAASKQHRATDRC